MREPRAQELVDWILGQEALRHLHDESFRPALWRWAQRQAMADLLLTALAAHHDAQTCVGCEQCHGWEVRWQIFDRTAERAGQAIGLDPQSRADLLVKMAAAGLTNANDHGKSMLQDLMEQLKAIHAVSGDEEQPTDLGDLPAMDGDARQN